MGKCVKSRPMYRGRSLCPGYGKPMHTTGVLNKYWNAVDLGIEPVLKSLDEKVGADIEILLNLYTSGNMSELKRVLTYEYYLKLALKLQNQKGDFSKVYTRHLSLIMSTLEGLYRGTILYDEYITKNKQLEKQIEQCKNPPKQFILQGEATLKTVDAIRGELVIYIKLYGLPSGGVFDAGKLAVIMSNLASDAN